MEIHLAPDVLTQVHGFVITNTLLVAVGMNICIILVALFITKRLQTIPRGFQFWAETALSGIYDLLNDITGDTSMTRTYFPFASTLIIFFLAANLLSFIPGIDLLTYHDHHVYRTVTTDYNAVLAVTLISFVLIHQSGIQGLGVWGYLRKYISFKSPIAFFVGILEFIGEFSRILSLSFRMFGNMFAKKVLMLVIFMLSPFIVPIPFTALGFVVAVVQPFVFFFIVMIYIVISRTHDEEEGHSSH